MKQTSLQRAMQSAICVLLSILTLSMPAYALTDDAALEDINGDGVVDVFDLVLSKRECVDAAKPFTVTVSSQPVLVGEIAYLDVTITHHPGFVSTYFVLQYDPALEVVTDDEGVCYTTGPAAGTQSYSLISCGLRGSLLCMTNHTAEATVDGLLLQIPFRMPEQGLDGKFYEVSVRDMGCVGLDGMSVSPLLYEQGGMRAIASQQRMPGPNPVDPKPLSWGIDVSAWQGTIDWAAVGTSGASFAMLRAGYGRYTKQVDGRFYENYEAAKAAGIPLGAYWYSYAMSPAEAVMEAEVCIQVLDGMAFEYPIAFDIEEYAQKCLGKEQFSAIIDAFCSTMQNAGYYTVIYTSASPMNTLVTEDVRAKYDVWVANYHVDKPIYTGKYGMWQYSSTGRVDGVASDVDMNYAYRDYASITAAHGLNGFSAPAAE